MVAATQSAATRMAAVARRRRRGVSHDHPRVASHARKPVAPAAVAAAVAMH